MVERVEDVVDEQRSGSYAYDRRFSPNRRPILPTATLSCQLQPYLANATISCQPPPYLANSRPILPADMVEGVEVVADQ